MRFGSVCSGIEAASVAWNPLGWDAAWFSEIEKFPCAVLQHHYPTVPNYGDMSLLPQRVLSGEVEAPDLLCGGTPCQAFSVAGLRKSLDDARGNLSLKFCELANAIDNVRSVRSIKPAIVFWENVPGVLNTNDNAFGCFLGALAGENEPLVPPGGRWSNAGCVFGPQRAVAWRVLDAQYFGVAQRRRRVFVVASARDDIDPTKILFEFDGVRRDIAPSREKGKAIAPTVTNGPPFSRTGNERVEADAIVLSYNHAVTGDVTKTLDVGQDYHHVPNVFQQQPYSVANTLTARMHKGINSTVDEGQTPVIALQDVSPREKAQNGRGWNDDGSSYTIDTHATQGVAVAMRDSIGANENATAAVAQPINFGAQMSVPQVDFDLCQTLQAKNPMAVAFDAYNQTINGDINQPLRASTAPGNVEAVEGVLQSMQVRRLTPVECERLQGFPDGYTNIKDKCPDGPRYKALGNSWAVPVVRWIGSRIDAAVQQNFLQ